MPKDKSANDDAIRFLLPTVQKFNFFAECARRGQTPSTVLRLLIASYLDGLQALPAPVRERKSKRERGKA